MIRFLFTSKLGLSNFFIKRNFGLPWEGTSCKQTSQDRVEVEGGIRSATSTHPCRLVDVLFTTTRSHLKSHHSNYNLRLIILIYLMFSLKNLEVISSRKNNASKVTIINWLINLQCNLQLFLSFIKFIRIWLKSFSHSR